MVQYYFKITKIKMLNNFRLNFENLKINLYICFLFNVSEKYKKQTYHYVIIKAVLKYISFTHIFNFIWTYHLKVFCHL